MANTITWVMDGERALDYVFRRGAYAERTDSGPRLILLDPKMPRLDGIEVLKAIRADERTRRIPVVMMTSSQEESDVARSYDVGVDSYIVKPVDWRARERDTTSGVLLAGDQSGRVAAARPRVNPRKLLRARSRRLPHCLRIESNLFTKPSRPATSVASQTASILSPS